MVGLDTVVYGDVTVLDLIVFAISVVIIVIVARIIAIYLKRALSDRMEREELDKLVKVVQVIIVLIGVWFALPSFDIDVGQLLVVGGTVGLIVAFASQKIVSNLGSGIFLLIERPVKIGDTIRIGETSGTVNQIHILSTIVKTYEGIYVRIPNEEVFTSEITNYVANPARRFEYLVSIGYGDDTGRAVQVIRKLLEDHPFVLRNPAPSVFVSELGDSGVELTVYIWAPSRVWWSVRTELLQKIKEALDREGIEIPFPQRVVTMAEARRRTEPAGESDRHAGQ
ncbi:MAG: mechanosensitive ion channel family protein [Methanomicrobiales archaeon]|nr:mechanosensitive ion channel family protein [Methanomicrobiales archaeon]NYT21527.1 mechanosensitive ion channel family protein [Methanomicrobiales archaeon]